MVNPARPTQFRPMTHIEEPTVSWAQWAVSGAKQMIIGGVKTTYDSIIGGASLLWNEQSAARLTSTGPELLLTTAQRKELGVIRSAIIDSVAEIHGYKKEYLDISEDGLTVWYKEGQKPAIKLDTTKNSELPAKIVALRTLYNEIYLENFSRLLDKNNVQISADVATAALNAEYTAVKDSLKDINAIAPADFRDKVEASRIISIAKKLNIGDIESLYTSFLQLNEIAPRIPVVRRGFPQKAVDVGVNEKIKTGLEIRASDSDGRFGVWGWGRTVYRKVGRVFDRFLYNIGYSNNHPCDMKREPKVLQENIKDLLANKPAAGAVVDRFLVDAATGEQTFNPAYLASVLDQNPLIESVLKIAHNKIADAFGDGRVLNSTHEKKTALDDCLKSLTAAAKKKLKKGQTVDPMQMKKLLAYMVPHAMYQAAYLELLGSEVKGFDEEFFDDADALREMLTHRRSEGAVLPIRRYAREENEVQFF